MWGSGGVWEGSHEEWVSACVAKVWWGEGAKGGRGAGGGDAAEGAGAAGAGVEEGVVCPGEGEEQRGAGGFTHAA